MRCDIRSQLVSSAEFLAPQVVRWKLSGRLTREEIPSFLACIAEVTATGAQRLLVDVSELSDIDRCGLGLLCSALFRLRRSGGTLVVVAVSPAVDQLLTATGLVHFFLMPCADLGPLSSSDPVPPSMSDCHFKGSV